jgi:hypothetical protein
LCKQSIFKINRKYSIKTAISASNSQANRLKMAAISKTNRPLPDAPFIIAGDKNALLAKNVNILFYYFFGGNGLALRWASGIRSCAWVYPMFQRP